MDVMEVGNEAASLEFIFDAVNKTMTVFAHMGASA